MLASLNRTDPSQLEIYKKHFSALDKDRRGSISIDDLNRSSFATTGSPLRIDGGTMEIDFATYVKLMSASGPANLDLVPHPSACYSNP